jgi:hypothetical protein
VWNTKGVDGVHRFLARVYRLITGPLSSGAPTAEQLRQLHQTIKKVLCWAGGSPQRCLAALRTEPFFADGILFGG